MRIDLSDIMERGEGPLLLFQKRTGVIYEWDSGGFAHDRQAVEGYLVPVGDSILRSHLPELHIGHADAEDKTGGSLADEDMDQLDSLFRLAGVPFMVDRFVQVWYESTENAVGVRFPGWNESVPLAGSRLAKWRPYWGKRAVFIWWNCENESERKLREEQEKNAESEGDFEGDYLAELLGSAAYPGGL